MTEAQLRTGPILAKSYGEVDLFAGTRDGQRVWVPLGDPAIDLYPLEHARSRAPESDTTFVEVLDLAPGFQDIEISTQTVEGSLREDYDIWVGRMNEILRENGEFKRFLGLYTDDHDHYYILQPESGGIHYVSMTMRVEKIKDVLQPSEYEAIEQDMRDAGSMPVDGFHIFREIVRSWPRADAPAALIIVVNENEGFIYGPFESEEKLEACRVQTAAAAGGGVTTSWKDSYAEREAYRGVMITKDHLEFPESKVVDLEIFDFYDAIVRISGDDQS